METSLQRLGCNWLRGDWKRQRRTWSNNRSDNRRGREVFGPRQGCFADDGPRGGLPLTCKCGGSACCGRWHNAREARTEGPSWHTMIVKHDKAPCWKFTAVRKLPIMPYNFQRVVFYCMFYDIPWLSYDIFLVNVAERCDAMTFRAPIVFEPPEPREQAGKTMSTRVRIRLCTSRGHQGMKV